MNHFRWRFAATQRNLSQSWRLLCKHDRSHCGCEYSDTLQDRLDDVSQAGQWYRKALTTMDQASGGSGTCKDTVCASLCSNLGSILAESKRPKDAIPLLHRALVIREERLGHQHPDTVDIMYDLGILLANVGMMKQAASHLSNAVKLDSVHSSAGDAQRVLNAIGGAHV